MMPVWIYSLMFLGAFFNACMDMCENEPNYNKSVFRNLDKGFWLKTASWENKYKKIIIKLPYIWWTKGGKT